MKPASHDPDHRTQVIALFLKDIAIAGTQPGNLFSNMEALGWTEDQLLEIVGDEYEKWDKMWHEARHLNNHGELERAVEEEFGLRML